MANVVTQVSRGEVVRELHSFVEVWSSRIETWKSKAQGHTESTAAQQFWGHLLRCFGVIPERIDLFERDAKRATTGNTGYIDLFWSSVVLGEAKSLGKDLVKAESQALDYLAGGSIASHEWPKFVITTNFETIRLTKLGDDGWTKQFLLEELADHVEQLMFLAGREEVTNVKQTTASIAASQLMADHFTAMTSTEVDKATGDEASTSPEDEDWHVQKSSVFLTRVLFLLYGDGAGLWENDLFYRFILNDTDDENLGSQLAGLFQVSNTPENRRQRVPDSMAKFRYINGSLFDDYWPLFLDVLRKESNRLIGNRSATVKALREFRDSLSANAFCDPAFIRKSAAHEPRLEWSLTEQDALDALGTVSLVHRRLDQAGDLRSSA